MAKLARRFSRSVYSCYVDAATGQPLLSLTRQSEAEGCDINSIVKRFQKTGQITHLRSGSHANLGDVSDLGPGTDFQAALNYLGEAQSAFDALPAVVRKEFDNDPSKFLDFAMKSENVDKLVEWGLATRPPVVLPQRVEVVNMPVEEPVVEPSPAPPKPVKKGFTR